MQRQRMSEKDFWSNCEIVLSSPVFCVNAQIGPNVVSIPATKVAIAVFAGELNGTEHLLEVQEDTARPQREQTHCWIRIPF